MTSGEHVDRRGSRPTLERGERRAWFTEICIQRRGSTWWYEPGIVSVRVLDVQALDDLSMVTVKECGLPTFRNVWQVCSCVLHPNPFV
jgi:hypothetical protein